MMRFTVPGQPVGKARARTIVNRGRVHSYTPNKTTAYESTVRLAFTAAYPGHVPLEGPIHLTAYAYFMPPKCLKPKPPYSHEDIPHTKRPDSDNICKSIFDAGNGVIWRDDSQIAELTIKKSYSMRPRVDVWIMQVEGGK